MTRWIVGNLDAETELARAGRPGVAALPRAVRRRLSAAATLLGVFAAEGDALWTPEPVDPARLPAVPGLPRPRLVHGPWEPRGPLLPWCALPGLGAPTRERPVAAATEPLHVRLWRTSPGDGTAAPTVLHRAFAHGLAREWGVALPGARLVDGAEELDTALAELGADDGRWVVKPPYSAAGRGLVLGRGAAPQEPQRRRLHGLLAAHGTLLVEPWLERVADLGQCGIVEEHGVALLPLHVSQTDARGRFRGVQVAGAAMAPAELPAGGDAELADLVRRVGERLADAGHRGPFGVDAWVARDGSGAPRLQLLGEVNARMSFGLVARALLERVGGALGWTGLTLRFDGQPPRSTDAQVVLTGTDDEPTWAWVEPAAHAREAAPAGGR